MSQQIIDRAREAIEGIAVRHSLDIEQVIVYGSQAREDHCEDSDLDIVIVSPDWEGINYYARPERFDIERPYDDLPPISSR